MATSIPENSDSLLTRQQTGLALREAGYPIADKTLATRASRGGGPPYRRFGARVLYRWADVMAWAESRLSPPVFTTSENDVDGKPRTALPTGSKSGQPASRHRRARLVANSTAI